MDKMSVKQPVIADAVVVDEFLAGEHGVVFKKVDQPKSTCYKPIKYEFSPLPFDKHALKSNNDKEGWRPRKAETENLVFTHYANESSYGGCCLKCCQNFRPYTMHLRSKQGGVSPFSVKKEFSCCYCPPEIELLNNRQTIGRVVPKCGPFFLCQEYCCIQEYNMQLVENGKLRNKFKFVYNSSCFGPHNNVCAPTICKKNELFDVYRYNSAGKVDKTQEIGHVQRIYVSGCGSCCCDRNNGKNKYLIEWPINATPEEKALFISTMIMLDFHYMTEV